MTRLGVVLRPQIAPEALRDAVRRCEDAGVDDVWLCEDCFLTGGPTTATAVLSWTERLRVGLGLIPVPLRNPALAAMEIATVTRLFPGRFAPALGHGVQDWMTQTGAEVASPMTLLREHTRAVRDLLHGVRVDADGRYVRLDGVSLDWPPPVPPPLLLGARGNKTLALAGELADGVVLDDGPPGRPGTPEALAASVATATEARRSSALAGEPFEVVAYVALDGSDELTRALAMVEAGATTIALHPAGDDPDPGEALTAVAALRAALGS